MRKLIEAMFRRGLFPGAAKCPATQEVHRQRRGNYLTMHRMLLAETGKSLPAVERLIGVKNER